MGSKAVRPLDPDGRYPSEGPRKVELQAARVLAVLPTAAVSRTRDVIQLDVEVGEAGVTVLVTSEALELRLTTVEWTTGYGGPTESSRLWKRVRWQSLGDTDDGLRELIETALDRRRREFAACRYCGRRVPPERRIGRACHGCASAHEGVVY